MAHSVATVTQLPPRRHEKLSELVAREIVHDIAARGVEPGSMLPPETVMLAAYGVGRASLREALRILEVQGLIVIKPGIRGGPMVAGVDSHHFGRMATLFLQLSHATFGDVIEARLVVEPVMARLAAERRVPENMATLRAYLEQPDVTPAGDARPLLVLSEFHAMVAGMSGNPVLDLFGRAVKDIYTGRQHDAAFPTASRDRVVADHVAIAGAILAGDGEAAERLMRAHMEEWATHSAARFPGIHDEAVHWR